MVTLTFDILQNQISVKVELDIVGSVKYHLFSIVYAWFHLVWARHGFFNTHLFPMAVGGKKSALCLHPFAHISIVFP